MARMKFNLFFLFCWALLVPSAFAEIERLAIPSLSCKNEICFLWWPKIRAPTGWHHDYEASLQTSSNVFAPDGSTFADAETVMYAKAVYKPSDPETQSLEMFIEKDKKAFSKDTTVKVLADLKTADGQKLKSLSFFSHDKGNFEKVSYGEEGDFYLVFAISSRTRHGYDGVTEIFDQFVASYREKP